MSQVLANTSRISAKLALALVIFGLLYSVGLTGVYIYLELPQAEKELEGDFNRILDTFIQPATQAVFHLDSESAENTLKGLEHYSFIERAVIRSDTGEILAEAEFDRDVQKYPAFLYWVFDYPELVSHERSLSDERFEENVNGLLKIDINLLRAHNTLVDKIYTVVGANVLQVFVFVLIVYYIVHRLIARRLIEIDRALSVISPESPEGNRVPTFENKDEISSLSNSINRFIDSADTHIELKNDAEKGLRYLTQHLEEVIQQRTADLAKAVEDAEQSRDEADKANRAKSIFLSNMSHELRTPLNSIIGFTHRLLKKKQSSLGEREIDALERVYDNGQYLLHLVNDILDIAKIEAEKMELQYGEVSINDLLENCFKKVSTLADTKQLNMECLIEESICLDGDSAKLQQIFINVISNAIKYTNEGSIRIYSKGIQNGVLAISVQDTGIGIKEEDFSKLFDPYNHVHSNLNESVSFQSTGLGLPLARKLALLHGGDIQVESVYGAGSTFTVLLPMSNVKKAG